MIDMQLWDDDFAAFLNSSILLDGMTYIYIIQASYRRAVCWTDSHASQPGILLRESRRASRVKCQSRIGSGRKNTNWLQR